MPCFLVALCHITIYWGVYLQTLIVASATLQGWDFKFPCPSPPSPFPAIGVPDTL